MAAIMGKSGELQYDPGGGLEEIGYLDTWRLDLNVDTEEITEFAAGDTVAKEYASCLKSAEGSGSGTLDMTDAQQADIISIMADGALASKDMEVLLESGGNNLTFTVIITKCSLGATVQGKTTFSIDWIVTATAGNDAVTYVV